MHTCGHCMAATCSHSDVCRFCHEFACSELAILLCFRIYRRVLCLFTKVSVTYSAKAVMRVRINPFVNVVKRF